MKPENIKPFVYDRTTSHYTQVVWAESYEVGCGYIQFKNGKWYKKVSLI